MTIMTLQEAYQKILPLRSSGSSSEQQILQSTSALLDTVRTGGDAALTRLTQQFDGVRLTDFKVPLKEIQEAYNRSEPALKNAIRFTVERLTAFHLPQLQMGYSLSGEGKRLGQIIRPLSRVMVYVPGGTAIYVSSLLMNVIPAQIAGVRTLAVASPPQKNGKLPDSLLCACSILGIEEVYALGGVQAIGAFAYGTESIQKADKIVGPGNAYVAAAKKLVFGEVGIDMIAGPSEVLILCDETAEPQWVAADALAQLEHDTLAKAIILSDSLKVLESVGSELTRQMSTLSRKKILSTSVTDNCHLILTDSLTEAIEFANAYAPEHLGLALRNPEEILDAIDNAGAIFMGGYTPEAVGDYTAGSNHVLPTLGTARFQSPLGVYDFQKRMSYVSYTSKALQEDLETIRTLTLQEGLDAHRAATEIRLLKSTESQ